MGQKKYKIVIFGNKLYREISLPDTAGMSTVCIGTTSKCIGAAKLDRQRFDNSDFEISVICGDDGQWTARCENGVEFVLNGSLHIKKKLLAQWQEFDVFQQSSGKNIFKLSFELDFESEHKEYDYVINCAGLGLIQIGSTSDCHIMINDKIVENGRVTLSVTNNGYDVAVSNVKNGVYVNGYRMTSDRFKVNDRDFLMIAGYSFYIKGCQFYTHYCEQLRVSTGISASLLRSNYSLAYPKFVLSTNIKDVVPSGEIEVLPPKEKEKPRQQGIITSLLPTLLTFSACLVMRGMMGSSGWYMMIMMSAGVLTSVITFVSDIIRRKKDEKKRQETYKRYIENKENDIIQARKDEIILLNRIYRPTSESVKTLQEFSGELFDRCIDNEDFLSITLGSGTLASKRQIKSNKRESIDCDDDLALLPENLEKEYSMVSNVPITINLKKSNAVGCVGTAMANNNMLRMFTLDIALRHFYGEVKLFYIFNEEDVVNFRWVRWLNHVHNNRLDLRNIVCDRESKDALFEFLYSELSLRSQGGDDKSYNVYYVVFVYDDMGLYSHPISQFVKKASQYGFTFIFFENYRERLPRYCDWIIMLDNSSNRGKLFNTGDSKDVSEFVYESIPDYTANEVASLIAPVYVDEVSLENTLTRSITFYEMYNVYSADELDFGMYWSLSDVTRSMAAPLGVRTGNELVTLDLHENFDGPHGLVAGTTGAGKSEIVQAYILSMAVRFHPYDVGFIIIDWKGGGLSTQFDNLPHIIGVLTSIDGENGIHRFLDSLASERSSRLRRFNECGVNHIDAYIAKYKNGEVSEPMPHIILVVDEFAELKKEYKSFIEEIIKISRVGRSIGIHLILATQEPGSSVDEDIKTNTKFALCLRTASANDSIKVIRSPLAFEIKNEERGRAYLQVGNNEKFFLFQSAYSSADIDASAQNDSKQFKLYELSTWGKRTVRFEKKGLKKKSSDKKDNKNKQVYAVCTRISEYCKNNGIKQLAPICYPPLEEFIKYSDSLKYFGKFTGDISLGIGIYDDPSTQRQEPYYLPISSGNTLIIGSHSSGKTNTLEYIIRALSEQYTPEQVSFYIIDFSSSCALAKFSYGLNTVGGVVTKNDDDAYKNLIKMLNAQINYRQERFNSVPGVCDSYRSYVSAGYTDLPFIVVFIENISGVNEKFNDNSPVMDKELMYLINSGVSMGISFVATNQASGYYWEAFLNRIVFRCNDSAEYRSVLDNYLNVQPKNNPGRAILSLNDKIVQCQMFSAFDQDNAKDRQSFGKRMVEDLNIRYPDSRAMQIPSVPNVVTLDFIWNNFMMGMTGRYEIPVGIDYARIEPVTINMNDPKKPVFFICGAPKSPCGNKMAVNIVRELQNRTAEYPVELYVIDTFERQLAALKDMPITRNYTLDSGYIVELMKYIGEEAKKRRKMKEDNRLDLLEEESLIFVALQNNEAIDALCGDAEALEVYKSLFKQYKEEKICIAFTDIENAEIRPYVSPEPLRMLIEAKMGFCYLPLIDFKLFGEVSYKEREANRKPLVEDSCFSLNGSDPIMRIKTISDC